MERPTEPRYWQRATLPLFAGLALFAALALLAPQKTGAQNVTVEWNDTRQTIDGFGASDAWYVDEIREHPNASTLMDLLFSQTSGAGLSILRHRVGRNVYDGPGLYDWTEGSFTDAGWTAQQAQARGVDRIMASSWSAPSWMKDNNQVSGGGFLESQHYADFADWLATWIERMESDYGVEYYAISPQNEPGTKPWESMEWTASSYNVFLRDYLRPEFSSRNISTLVMGSEETRWGKVDDYADVFMNDAVTSGFVDIVAGHAYDFNPNSSGSPTTDYTYYGKPVWMTEWSYDIYAEDASIDNGVEWAVNFWHLLVDANVSAAFHWWAVSFQTNGNQQGLINADATSYSTTKRLFTIGQYARFVRPGWVRIDATKKPHSDVYVAAFRDPATDDFALVVINESSSSRSINVNFDGFTAGSIGRHRTTSSQDIGSQSNLSSGSGFSTSVAGKSVTTFTGSGTATGGTTFPVADTWYRLESVQNGRYLDTSSNGSVGTSSNQWGDGKQFRFIDAGGGYYWIDNKRSGRGALDTGSGGSVKWKTETMPSGDDKLWTVESAGDGSYRFRNKKSGRDYLVVSGSSGASYNTGGTGTDTKWTLEAMGAVSLVVANDDGGELPEAFGLDGVFPNPVRTSATLSLSLAQAAEVRAVVYDLLGRAVYAAPPAALSAGFSRSLPLDLGEVAPGTYLVRIEAHGLDGGLDVATSRFVVLQ